jgi:hypothetical protein
LGRTVLASAPLRRVYLFLQPWTPAASMVRAGVFPFIRVMSAPRKKWQGQGRRRAKTLPLCRWGADKWSHGRGQPSGRRPRPLRYRRAELGLGHNALCRGGHGYLPAEVAERGVVQVMRDVLADASVGGSGISWLGTRLEMSRRLRSDPALREEWEQLTRELTEAIRAGCSASAKPVLFVAMSALRCSLSTWLLTSKASCHTWRWGLDRRP